MSEVALWVEGVKHTGWQSVDIQRALDQAAGGFSVALTERVTGRNQPLKIKAGQAVVVKIDNATVITGYIDQVAVNYDERSHSVNVSGRSKTADLIDCSAPSAHFVNQTLVQIAAALCKPFGIGIKSTIEPIVVRDVKNEEGETVFELLEKLARANNAVLTDDPGGNLVITRGGNGPTFEALELGKNIKACGGTFDYADRYSLYIGKGSIPGDDFNYGLNAAQVTGAASDSNVKRYRPLVILPEEGLTTAQIQQRMNWEANVRAARSIAINYEVLGWADSQGQLYAPNGRIRVTDAFMGIDQELLIASVQYRIDNGGLMSTLELTAPGSYAAQPLPQAIDSQPVKRPSGARL